MQLDETFANVQPQAGASITPAYRSVQLLKRPEELSEIGWRIPGQYLQPLFYMCLFVEQEPDTALSVKRPPLLRRFINTSVMRVYHKKWMVSRLASLLLTSNPFRS